MLTFTEAQVLDWVSPLLWPFLRVLALFSAMPVLAATGPWMGSTILRYAQRCLGGFVDVVH